MFMQFSVRFKHSCAVPILMMGVMLTKLDYQRANVSRKLDNLEKTSWKAGKIRRNLQPEKGY